MVVNVDFKAETAVKDFVRRKKKLIGFTRIFIVSSSAMLFHTVEKLLLSHRALKFGTTHERQSVWVDANSGLPIY